MILTLEINPLEDIPIERIKNELRNLIECFNSFWDKNERWRLEEQYSHNYHI